MVIFLIVLPKPLLSAMTHTAAPKKSSDRSPNTLASPKHVIRKRFGHSKLLSFSLFLFSAFLSIASLQRIPCSSVCVCLCVGVCVPMFFVTVLSQLVRRRSIVAHHYAVTERHASSRHTVTAATHTSRWILGEPTGGCQIARQPDTMQTSQRNGYLCHSWSIVFG